jgi:hypothetical protein
MEAVQPMRTFTASSPGPDLILSDKVEEVVDNAKDTLHRK